MWSVLLATIVSAAPCDGQRVVLVPLEPVASTPQAAREIEESVRTVLEGTAGLCVEARSATVKRVVALDGRRLPVCAELACTQAQLKSLEADTLVQGIVLGVGAQLTVELTIARAERTSRTIGTPQEIPAVLRVALTEASSTSSTSSFPRWPSLLTGIVGAVSFGTGIALGIGAQERSRMLSMGNASCMSGAMLPGCLDAELRAGKTEATSATVLFTVGGAFLAAAIILWVVSLQ